MPSLSGCLHLSVHRVATGALGHIVDVNITGSQVPGRDLCALLLFVKLPSMIRMQRLSPESGNSCSASLEDWSVSHNSLFTPKKKASQVT